MSNDTEAARVAWAKATCAAWARAADAADRAWEAAAHAIKAAQSTDASAAADAVAVAKEKVAIAIVETRSAADVSTSADAVLEARLSELDRLEQCRPDAGYVDFTLPIKAIRVRRVRPQAVLPRYMSAGAAGLDLSAALEHELWVLVGQVMFVPTGLVVELPLGYEGQVRPRSGLAVRHGLTVLNASGTIDSDYRGEVFVLLVNHGSQSVRIEPGMRIAQLVVAPVMRVDVVEAAELSPTARGDGGCGSTG